MNTIAEKLINCEGLSFFYDTIKNIDLTQLQAEITALDARISALENAANNA